MLTDYALGGVSGVLGLLIFKNNAASARFWGLAFVALAVAAFLGGTFHGFQISWVWNPTVLAVGIASFGMLAGSACTTTSGKVRRALLAAAVLKLVLYEAWMIGHDDFIFVVADTASAMLAVAALHLLALDNPATRWMLGGVAVSLIAAGIPASRIVIAGDSAGAGLALSLLLVLRDANEPQPAAAALFSPCADLAATGNSITENSTADPMLHQTPAGSPWAHP
jgi:hypothetical protein